MNLLQVSTTPIAETASTVANTTSSFVSNITHFAYDYAPKIIGAILIYIIGNWIINKVVAVVGKVLSAKNYDASLQSFLKSFIKIALTIMLLLTIMGKLGVEMGIFTGAMAGFALAIGGAMNGSLGNLAGGVMMLIFKPFKVGDMIEAQSVTGTVIEQGVFNTSILTPENKTIFVPNGPLSTGIITNYTTHGNLRVDLTMAIAPNMDIEKARQVAISAMLTHPDVLKTPSPEVNVLKVADGMVTLAIRPYCVQANYWNVYFGCQELVKKAWDNNGVDGPTPHRVLITKNA